MPRRLLWAQGIAGQPNVGNLSDRPPAGAATYGQSFFAKDKGRLFECAEIEANVFDWIDVTQTSGPSGGDGPVVFLESEPGLEGDMGPPGPPGPLGIQGVPGSAGAQGVAGPAVYLEAEAPSDGDMGPPGPPGVQGPSGTTGSTGAQGIAGPAVYLDADAPLDGDMGPPGIPGTVGASGLPGSTGAQGPSGPAVYLDAEAPSDGDMGPPGLAGTPGASGSPGSTGAQGPSGPAVYLDAEAPPDGEIGPPGLQGAAGAQGTVGPSGAQGPLGPAVFLDAEAPADGDIGPPGALGAQGVTGNPGPMGPAIFLDAEAPADGDMGPPGVPGPTPLSQALSSIADQAISAATLTTITGTVIAVPPNGMIARQRYVWRVMLTKTAAGTAASSFFIKIGTTGGTGDATVATFTTGLGTAAIDAGWIDVELVVRTLGAAATAEAYLRFGHNLSATGWLVIPTAVIAGTMATWNSAVAALLVSLAVTSGSSVAPTVQMANGVCVNPN